MEAIAVDPGATGLDRVRLTEVPDPVPRAGEVLVRVEAVALSAWERGAVTLDERALRRRSRGRRAALGLEFAGVVHRGGGRFEPGQRVFGAPHLTRGEKALARFVSVPEDHLAALPDDLGAVPACTLPIAAETARRACDAALARGGRDLLVLGAGGGVGVLLTQLAAARGAVVHALASGPAVAGLRDLGATVSRSYADTDWRELAEEFDAVVDLSGTTTFARVRPGLSARGVYVSANPDRDLGGVARALVSRRRMPLVYVPRSSRRGLERTLDLVAAGTLRPVVEAVHDLAHFRDAFEQLVGTPRSGRIVLTL